MRFTLSTILAVASLTSLTLASPFALPLTPDPAGVPNIGNGKGTQFIGGACLSEADCASGCCAGLNGKGICSGPDASTQAGKTGCGFSSTGSGTSAAPPATSTPAASAGSSSGSSTGSASCDQSESGAANCGAGNGQQFITGQCLSNADCASTCCAGLNGKGVCSATAVANENGKSGCGFSSA